MGVWSIPQKILNFSTPDTPFAAILEPLYLQALIALTGETYSCKKHTVMVPFSFKLYIFFNLFLLFVTGSELVNTQNSTDGRKLSAIILIKFV